MLQAMLQGPNLPSSEPVPAPRNDNPIPVTGELNRWCVEGNWQIYQDAKIINDKQKMARLITEEHRVLTGSLHTVPKIHRLFNLHKCDWMARDPETYNEEIVREFYASYAATLRDLISKQSKPLAQDPLTSTMVRDGTSCGVALSRGMLSSEKLLYYGWLVRNRVSPTKADNQLTWDRAVIVAALGAEVEIDFSRMLLVEIHERACKTSTTYPFPCLIFQFCRDSGVPIWHCDREIGGSDGHTVASHPALDAKVDSRVRGQHQAKDGGHDGPEVQAVNKCLDAFELRVLERSTPIVDLSSLQSELECLRADVDAILATPTIEPQAAPNALADDTVLDALFSGTAEEEPEHTHTKVLDWDLEVKLVIN
ncbi:hypothetical protein H5410_045870 [Solanum commersonii]|uniref:Putative plant transposon protein domain-containing protein n=1 Tax=Solanum commersonii TaxID=4109 RepID=A0A9J5XDZ7_SOLCO|nr:hypothetical protein H5410_045870 [Solanum commersonii]